MTPKNYCTTRPTCAVLAARTLAPTVFLLFIFCFGAYAQSDAGSASIEGEARDANRAGIAGAVVTVRNTETGLTRQTTSDAQGRFNFSVLPVGRYAVTVTANGFKAASNDNALLRVGEATVVEFSLQPSGVAENVTVSAETEALDTETNSVGSVIAPRSIENLPIRGRNFVEFVQLTPAVVQESDRFGLVIAGQRSINSNVAVDGADFNDALQGNQRGGNEGVFFFPQTAVREFQVVRSGASAEVGRTNAGFVNAVTKSGTNDLRGEAFYFSRNKALTSPNAFGFKGSNKQNQFGGSVGGAIRKDKAFFFVGFEQNFLQIPYNVQFAAAPAGVIVPTDVLALQGEQRATNNPTAFFARFDFNLSERNTLNFQYNYSRLKGENFNSSQDGSGSSLTSVAATGNYERRTDSHGVKGSLVTVLTPNLVNEARAQVATDDRSETPNVNLPQVTISGFGTLGGDSGRPRLFEATRYEATDNVSLNRGSHRFRFGVDLNINDARQQRESNLLGRYDFSSLADYIARRPVRYRQTLPGFNPDELIYKGTQKEIALYAQDRFNLSPNVTATAGLRWEGQYNPQPTRPNPSIPETARIPNDLKQFQPRLGLAWNVNGTGRNVVRLSAGIFAARTPANLFQRVFTDNGITAQAVDIRELSACVSSTDPNRAGCVLRGPNAIVNFPNGLSALPAPSGSSVRVNLAPRVFGFDPNFRNPRSFQTSAEIEHSFSGDLVLSVGYTHNSTWNLQRRLDRNLFPPVTNVNDPAIGNNATLITLFNAGLPIFPKTRPNPAIGQFSVNESTAHSKYDGMTVSLTRRFARRYQMQMNYTLARTRDDDSNERNFSRETALNPFNTKIEDAPSKQDVRHNFNVSGLVDLGRGFTASGIIITRSGFPFTPVIGTDQQNDSNDDNDRALINGRIAGRNSLRQPYFFDLDLRLLKGFRLGETKRLDLSAEVFNVTRNGNKSFGNDSVSVYGVPRADGSPSVPTAGQPLFAPTTARFGGPRQVQFGARFVF